MSIPFAPAISAAGSIRPGRVLGHHEIRVSSDETAGTMGVWEEAAEPGEGPPLHIHHREEEMFFVLEGHFRFHCGDEVFEGGPGTTAVLPRGVPHTWQCIGDARGRMLVSVTPGGFERFFLDLEALPHADPVAVATLAAGYGLQFCASRA
jgi:quercetin dioxygenase-like cupin family protein